MKIYLMLLLALNSTGAFSGRAGPGPDSIDVKYGPSDRNIFDFWRADSDTLSPLVVYFHGGGFNSGSKKKVSESLIRKLLAAGISFMSVEYRLTPEVSFPQHYKDCARAIQYIRHKWRQFNVDPLRIGATGSSAGGCAALWISFHDDLGNDSDPDPVNRQSTRLRCAALHSAQSTLDPVEIRKLIGELPLTHSIFKGPFIGLRPDEARSEKAESLYIQASPVTYLTMDDPPVWAYYSRPDSQPGNMSDAIHHPRFGGYLKSRMDKLGIRCDLLSRDDSSSATESCVSFFKEILRPE